MLAGGRPLPLEGATKLDAVPDAPSRTALRNLLRTPPSSRHVLALNSWGDSGSRV